MLNHVQFLQPHGLYSARLLHPRDFPGKNISFSRGSSWPKDQTCLFYVGRQILYPWATNRFSNSSKFKRNENINPHKNWYLNVLSSTVDCSPKIERTQMFNFQCMIQQNAVYLYNRILSSNENEWSVNAHFNMDESRKKIILIPIGTEECIWLNWYKMSIIG